MFIVDTARFLDDCKTIDSTKMDHAKSYINILDKGRHHGHPTSQLPNLHNFNLSHLGKTSMELEHGFICLVFHNA